MNALTPFEFEGTAVRVTGKEGEPWFVLADVCRVLEIGNPSQAATRLDNDEKSSISATLISNEGGADPVIINESGLYSLILTSRKEAAKRFKKWVTSEVLPAIRKTGQYGASSIDALLADPAALRTALLGYSERVIALESKVMDQAPKVQAFDRISGSDGSLCITDAAKALQMRPRDLFSWLSEHRWIYRRLGNPSFVGYQEKIQAGYLEQKVTTVNRSDGSEKAVESVRVTPKGLAYLAKKFETPVDTLI